MKLQHAAVMFVIIFIPIILVTSYFINLQVKTVELESSYNEKLLNAAYDAMTAFELNTANEDLSTVSDSLRSIIDASNNIFFNTLCTNFGISNASKSYLQPYIPAIVYTLYDGYYIYSPTNIPEICVDSHGRTIRTSDYGVKRSTTVTRDGITIGMYTFDESLVVYSTSNPAEPAEEQPVGSERLKYGGTDGIGDEYDQILYKNNDGTYSTQLHTWADNYPQSTYYKRDYILKSYIPYAARYYDDNGTVSNSKDDIDITVNYTLDNFMTIEGMIKDVYYTKSGYLIDANLVDKIVVTGPAGMNQTIEADSWTAISEEKLDEYIKNPRDYEVTVTLVETRKVDGSPDMTIEISNRLGAVDINLETGGSKREYWDDAQSAVEYYVDSFIFSQWIYQELDKISAKKLANTQYSVSDIQNSNTSDLYNQTELNKEMLHDFTIDDSLPFSSDNNNPEDEESGFYKHKRNVIKNSITYNLVLSMLVYTEESRTVEFNMPVLKESEWDRILNNVSITVFMEGMRCGLKYYNNYAIVTSTNNEITVTDNEIYYVPRIRKTATETIVLNDMEEVISPDSEDLTSKYKIAHRIDCEELDLLTEISEPDGTITLASYGAVSFKAKEVKYDKILDSSGKYKYDHKVYTDYDCIVDSNYTTPVCDAHGNIVGRTDGNTDILKYLQNNSNDKPIASRLQKNCYAKLKAYRIAIAKERNNLYKTTAFVENYGRQILVMDQLCPGTFNVSDWKKPIKEIKKIEVKLDGTTAEKVGVNASNVFVIYKDSLGNNIRLYRDRRCENYFSRYIDYAGYRV